MMATLLDDPACCHAYKVKKKECFCFQEEGSPDMVKHKQICSVITSMHHVMRMNTHFSKLNHPPVMNQAPQRVTDCDPQCHYST